jgi:hypothetical protein
MSIKSGEKMRGKWHIMRRKSEEERRRAQYIKRIKND